MDEKDILSLSVVLFDPSHTCFRLAGFDDVSPSLSLSLTLLFASVMPFERSQQAFLRSDLSVT